VQCPCSGWKHSGGGALISIVFRETLDANQMTQRKADASSVIGCQKAASKNSGAHSDLQLVRVLLVANLIRDLLSSGNACVKNLFSQPLDA
jgi:hypothetical protein